MNDTPSTAIPMSRLSLELVKLVTIVLSIDADMKSQNPSYALLHDAISQAKTIEAIYHDAEHQPQPMSYRERFYYLTTHNFIRYTNVLNKSNDDKAMLKALEFAKKEKAKVKEYETSIRSAEWIAEYDTQNTKPISANSVPLREINPYIDYEIQLLKLLKAVKEYQRKFERNLAFKGTNHDLHNKQMNARHKVFKEVDRIQRTIDNLSSFEASAQ